MKVTGEVTIKFEGPFTVTDGSSGWCQIQDSAGAVAAFYSAGMLSNERAAELCRILNAAYEKGLV